MNNNNLEELLQKALIERDKDAKKTVLDGSTLRKGLLETVFFMLYISVCSMIAMYDMSSYYMLSKSIMIEITMKIASITILTILYLRIRIMLKDLINDTKEDTSFASRKIVGLQDASDMMYFRGEEKRNKMLLALFIGLIPLSFIMLPGFYDTAFMILGKDGPVRILIGIMLVLFTIGTYICIRTYLTIDKEREQLELLEMRLYDKIPLYECLHIAPQVLKERLRHTLKLKEDSIEMTLKEVLQLPTNGHFFTRHIIHFIIGSMPILGLMGTVIGLTVSLAGLEGVIMSSGSDQAEFAKSTGIALQGIGTKFYSTITGILLMLLLKYLMMILVNAEKLLMMRAEHLLIRYIYPLLQKR